MQRDWLLVLVIFAFPSFGQTFRFEDERSKVAFTVKNFGLNVNGKLGGLEGIFTLHEVNIEKSYFEATVQGNTIDTGIALRDKHLRQKNYFDVEKYPVIRIASTGISKRGNQFIADAVVTIRNITKRVSIPFTIEKDQSRMILKSNFTLNRLDFDVGGKSFSMDDSVQVRLEIAGAID